MSTLGLLLPRLRLILATGLLALHPTLTSALQLKPAFDDGHGHDAAALQRLLARAGNPVALVRQVNAMVRLGEQQARPHFQTLGGDLNSSLLEGIEFPGLIVLASYERKDFVWPPDIFWENDDSHAQLASVSTVFPLIWLDDIPFWVADAQFSSYCRLPRPVIGGHTYAWHSPQDFLNWADAHAKFRRNLLALPNNPFAVVSSALETIARDRDLRALLGDDGIKHLAIDMRQQCMRMTEGVLDTFLEPSLANMDNVQRDQGFQVWQAYRAAVNLHPLRWDAALERYVVVGG